MAELAQRSTTAKEGIWGLKPDSLDCPMGPVSCSPVGTGSAWEAGGSHDMGGHTKVSELAPVHEFCLFPFLFPFLMKALNVNPELCI